MEFPNEDGLESPIVNEKYRLPRVYATFIKLGKKSLDPPLTDTRLLGSFPFRRPIDIRVHEFAGLQPNRFERLNAT